MWFFLIIFDTSKTDIVILFSSIDDFDLGSCAVSVGAFDGVHIGHVSVLNYLFELAQRSNLPSVVLTFKNHPQLFFKMRTDFRLLTTLDEKIELIKEKTNVDAIVQIPFDANISTLKYNDFVDKILKTRLRAEKIVMGYNHRFGVGGEGTFEKVKAFAEKKSIEVYNAPELYPGEHLSSSRIRKLLFEGNVSHSAKLLGYNYGFTANVIYGQQLGRKIGFPTVNLQPLSIDKLLPLQGVYIVKILIGNQIKHGILNYGVRPTINNISQPTIEVHIFDFSDVLYDKTIRVEFLERLRSEMKFNSIDELRSQIKRDKEKAENYLKSVEDK
ncbi:MAG TPA: bifunctional riboflavin kinase/FAD synthetase [Salinivirgaceae bacterium]|nr:bifunctional riboflavin kinase/FAD synthetase [Salinivirgaceae bacterium]